MEGPVHDSSTRQTSSLAGTAPGEVVEHGAAVQQAIGPEDVVDGIGYGHDLDIGAHGAVALDGGVVEDPLVTQGLGDEDWTS